MSEIKIMPINDSVAFQTIPVTSNTSCQVTTPINSAIAAPIQPTSLLIVFVVAL